MIIWRGILIWECQSIDYKKAYDMIPYSWILESLELV